MSSAHCILAPERERGHGRITNNYTHATSTARHKHSTPQARRAHMLCTRRSERIASDPAAVEVPPWLPAQCAPTRCTLQRNDEANAGTATPISGDVEQRQRKIAMTPFSLQARPKGVQDTNLETTELLATKLNDLGTV